MKINISDIPENKTVIDYSENTEFILDDRPVKIDPKTFERVFPDNPMYDKLPTFDYNQNKFVH
ncbi:MAG: hypothetical protein NC122_07025 [Faecalibacterium sp.]|nr:hypothetical protein [Ruminococcus sp.]MCM1392269.1 hypothetical protein [Ruminococcus sp.]MCM1485943.1 hypothetical protein [Faecalibacterium sp.]